VSPESPGESEFRTRFILPVALAGSLLLTVVLRFWGLAFSSSAPYARPDEELFIDTGFRYFDQIDPTERLKTGWPDGFFLITHWLQRLEAFVLGIVWKPEINLGCLYAVNPGAVAVVPRGFSALADSVACLLVGLIARRLAPAGLKSAALLFGVLALGCNYLAARDAHFAVSDASLLLTITLTLYALVRALQEDPRWLIGAGAAAGAGFAIKYSAAGLFVPCLLAGIGCWVRARDNRRRVLVWALGAVGAALLAFVLLSPNVLTVPGAFWSGLLSHQARFNQGSIQGYLLDPSAELPLGWIFHLKVTLPVAFGMVGLLLAFTGLWLTWRSDRWIAAVLCSCVVVFFLEVATVRMLFVRYAAPMVPALTVGLALALTQGLGEARRRWPGPRALALTAILSLAALLPPALRTVQFDHILSQPDTRDLAGQWLVDQGPEATVVTQGMFVEIHALEAQALVACEPVVPPWLFRKVPVLPGHFKDWQAFVDGGPSNWVKIAWEAQGRYLSGFSPPPQSARFVTESQGVLECGRYARLESSPLDPRCFTVEKIFSPGALACGAYLDIFDSFYVPYSSFEGQQRPGPEVRIFRNRCL
jgi:Dolichyl-phosphate-mannose-protein mannosyltransferase